ncbi:hypothetical protein ABZ639_06730 [Saccharomonospora sp. NPDC006951]
MTREPLTRDEIDDALRRHRDDGDRIAESLVAMDGHPGHRLLRNAALSGDSAARWASASADMAALWEQFASFRALLEKADEIRARRARPGEAEIAELSTLLSEPVIELDPRHVPIERRSLTGPSVVTERITLATLVERMKATFGTVTEVLAAADAAWTAATTRLDALDRQLAGVEAAAAAVAAEESGVTARIRSVRGDLAKARTRLLTDLLVPSAEDPLPALSDELTALRGQVDDLAATRDSFDDRLAALDALLGDIEAVEATARGTHAAVARKIASPGIAPPAGPATPALRARGLELERQAATGDWGKLGDRLTALESDAAAALGAARSSVTAATGLLDRRAELRGRLEAYRAKAARLGHAEDLDLTALHDEAHTLLFTAPCELAAATRALNRYQQAIRRRGFPGAAEEGSA